MKRYLRQPQFRLGDVVLKGDAIGYQGTFKMIGDISNYPESLISLTRNVYLVDYDADEEPIYKVEIHTDEDHLFKENWERFDRKVRRELSKNGLTMIED